MRMSMLVRAWTSLLLLFGLASCAIGEPLEHRRVADEIPSGPGLITGENGEFVLYRR